MWYKVTVNRCILAGATALSVALVVYVVGSAAKPAQQIAIGDPIRHDDFLFTVQRIAQRHSRGMTHYDVAILVQNQAVRVDYHWRDAIAYVTGSEGQRYRPTSDGEFVLAPGESRTANVQFDIPAFVRGASLRFWDGIFMGDALNGGAYAKAAIVLP